MTSPRGRPLSDLIQDIENLNTEAVSVINTERNLDVALEMANQLMTATRNIADNDTVLRNDLIGKIWDSEQMTLRALAHRVGISKSRADQLVKAKKEREEVE